MHQKTASTGNPAGATLLATLTTREVKVLCQRLGIDPDDANEDDIRRRLKLAPTGGGDRGQGGAPLNAAESLPPAAEERDQDELKMRQHGPRRSPH